MFSTEHQKYIGELRAKLRQAVADSEDALARWQRHTDPNKFNVNDRYQRQRDVIGKGILSDGEWAHRRAQTYGAALTAELLLMEAQEEFARESAA